MSTSPAEVLWTSRYDYQAHSKLELHKHKFFQIICIKGGEGCFCLDGQEIAIVPGRVFLIKPGQVHGLSAAAIIKTFDLKFVVQQSPLRHALLAAGNFVQEQEGSISKLVEQIRAEGESGGTFFRELCSSYLVHVLVAYLRAEEDKGIILHDSSFSVGDAADTRVRCEGVRKAVNFIREHYGEDLDEQLLARALGVSDRQLRQWFKASNEVSPMHYLARYRVEKAKEFIKYRNDPLKAVAELCGFKNIHRFNKVFSKFTGQPPGAWRRRFREGICKDVCIDPHFSNVILVRRNEDDLHPTLN